MASIISCHVLKTLPYMKVVQCENEFNKDGTPKVSYLNEFPKVTATADFIEFGQNASGELHVKTIVRAHDQGLPVEFRGMHAIPGGCLNCNQENFVAAASREVKEEAGQRSDSEVFLVGVPSDPKRDPRGHFVSAVYATINITDIDEHAMLHTADAQEVAKVEWIKVADICGGVVEMAFDHKKLVAIASDMLHIIKGIPKEQQSRILDLLRMQVAA